MIVLGFSAAPAAARDALNFRFSLASEPPTLDWNLATDNVSYQILNSLMEGLTQYDATLRPIPALAKSWEVSADGRMYTFHLDPKVRWSDGVPLTAQQFVDSWLRLLDPATAAEYAYFLYDLEGAQAFNRGEHHDPNRVGVRAIDPLTLQVRLRHPAVYFPTITTFMVTYPIRLDLISRFGAHWTEPPNLVSLGPYQLTQWRHEYKLVFQKNPSFTGTPAPEVEQIDIFIINEANTALSLFETGHLDFVELQAHAIPFFRQDRRFRSQSKLRGYYWGFNLAKKPFDDVRVRRAITQAIDRREFPRILNGGEWPTSSWIPKGMLGFNDKIGPAFDPKAAQELLAQAGYPGGRGFPRVLAAYNTDRTNMLVAENLQAQLKRNLNIDIVLDNQEWKMYLKALQLDTPALFRLGWGADYPDPDNFMNLFTSSSGNNHSRWKNPRYDQLIEQGAREADPQKRQAIYDEAQRLLCEIDVPIVSLFDVTANYLVAPRLREIDYNALAFIYWKAIRLKENP